MKKNALVFIKNGQIVPAEAIDKNFEGKARLIFEDEISDWDDTENDKAISKVLVKEIWENPEDEKYNET